MANRITTEEEYAEVNIDAAKTNTPVCTITTKVSNHGPSEIWVYLEHCSGTNYNNNVTISSQLLEYTKKNDHFLTHADQAVKQGLENARINVQWRKEHSDEVFKTIASFNFEQGISESD